MNTHPIEVMFSAEFEKTASLCGDFFYRYQRYEANFSMALFYSCDPIDKSVFDNILRQSDKCLKLLDNLYAIVFDMTSQGSGMKAVENILAQYEAQHFSQKLYISFVSAEDFNTKEAMKSNLFSLLNYAIKEAKSNQVVDGFYELEHI
ncbi:hypothetical protein JHD50_02560 [Sulfurimonas sp. MAG313]|nr:hypothetical protein [Sulfurimonas sp. MAG313]MDF1880194.1 hypothetical protein [Sulfurimonas sp. MAG313]